MQAESFPIGLVTSADDQNDKWGSSFVFHADEKYTYFATCAHVVHEVGGKDKVLIEQGSATVLILDDVVDIAILRVPLCPQLRTLQLGGKRGAGGDFRTAGFSKLGRDYRTSVFGGTFGNDFSIVKRGSGKHHRAWELLPEATREFEAGLSGSPVISETGECVAIVRLKMGDRGVAVSISAIVDLCPDLFLNPLEVEETERAVTNQPIRMNLEQEIKIFHRIIYGEDNQTNVILIGGPSGIGKTRILDEYCGIAKRFDLRPVIIKLGQYNVDNFLVTLGNIFAEQAKLPEFYKARTTLRTGSDIPEYYRIMGTSLLSDIGNIREGAMVVLLLDQYEKCDRLFKQWFEQHFMMEVATTRISALKPRKLMLVAAGQEVPQVDGLPSIRTFALRPPTPQQWSEYLQAYGIIREASFVQKVYDYCEGLPQRLLIAASTLHLEH